MKKYKPSQVENKAQLDNQAKQSKKAKQPGIVVSSGLKAAFSGGGY